MQKITDSVYLYSLEELVNLCADEKIQFYENNPRPKPAAIHSLQNESFSPASVAGIVLCRKTDGTLYIADGNTRITNLPLRSDWSSIKHTVTAVTIASPKEEKTVLANKLTGCRGNASLDQMANNPDFPCGKFICGIKSRLADEFGNQYVSKIVEKCPQGILNVVFHIRDNGGSFDAIGYNDGKRHHKNTPLVIQARDTKSVNEVLDSYWQNLIYEALSAYGDVLSEHKRGQNGAVDSLLYGKKFLILFLADHLSKGKSGFQGFSRKSTKRILQHLRAANAAYNVSLACSALLRSDDGFPRSLVVSTVNRYLSCKRTNKDA